MQTVSVQPNKNQRFILRTINSMGLQPIHKSRDGFMHKSVGVIAPIPTQNPKSLLFYFSLSFQFQIPNYSSLCPPTSKPQKVRITAARQLLGYSAFLPLRGSASVGCVAQRFCSLRLRGSATLCIAAILLRGSVTDSPSSIGFSLHRHHDASSGSHFSGSTFFSVTAYDLCGSTSGVLVDWVILLEFSLPLRKLLEWGMAEWG
ncbi:hypothetical protein S245_021527, partial [Arachis hypogaea]